MWLNTRNPKELREFLKAVFEYQFDKDVASALISLFPKMEFQFSKKTKKLKYIFIDQENFAAYKPQTGMFSLNFKAAEYILKKTNKPKMRVVVQSDIQDFIKDGKSVFSQHVISVDPALHIGDEVVIVNEEDQLLAIGKMSYPPSYINQKVKGSCIKVRRGIKSRTQ